MNGPKDQFTIGIIDDVTFKSFPLGKEAELGSDVYKAELFGLDADGTAGANKSSVKIAGENTNKYHRAYFACDSKKNGDFTVSHLRFGD